MPKQGTIPAICEQCHQPFLARAGNIKMRGMVRYCSMTCKRAAQAGEMRQCEQCGKEMYIIRSKLDEKRYCSRACQNAGFRERSGEKSAAWRGGKTINSGGYVVIRVGRRYVYEHRIVAEQMLGRPLGAKEVVHHRDGDKRNNDPSNLEITTQPEHLRRHSLVEQGRWARRYDACVMCGTTERPHYTHGLCRICHDRQWR